MTASEVAGLAVRQLGIVVPEADRPALTAVVTPDDIAAQALRAVGVNPIAGGSVAGGVTVASDVAARALLLLGVNPEGVLGLDTGDAFTRAQVAVRVLTKLAIIASDETPQAPDLADATAKVSAVHDELTKLGIATWNADATPDRAVEYVVIMASNLLASEFGKQGSAESVQAARDALRMQALAGQTAQNRAIVTVQNVHNDLAASGMVDWDTSTIPLSLAEAYAMMTAQLLAPIYGKLQDMTASDAAEGRVRRVALSGLRGQTLAVQKVQSVHDVLVSAGLVSWTLDDGVPLAFSDDYIAMAAVLLSPIMGRPQTPADRQADQAAWDAAEGRIRRSALIATAQDRAVAKVRAVYGELTAIGLVDYDINLLPGAIGDAIAGLAASELGPDFGKEETPAALEARWTRIRQVAMGGPAGQKLAEQKVIAIHESLAARGRVRWSLWDLPVFAEEDYCFMAATWLADEVGVKANPAWWPAAEMDLIRIVSVPTNYGTVKATYF